LAKNSKIPPLVTSPPETSELESKNFVFNRNYRTFRIRGGFDSSLAAGGWRFIAKKVPATVVTGAGVEDKEFYLKKSIHAIIPSSV